MRYLCVLFLFLPELLFAQWTISNGLFSGRKDDVYFVNDSLGYAVAGSSGEIGRTIDGGDNWTTIFTANNYLRSVEFIDASTGFCGSLDSILLMTTDSGNTWVDIADSISTKPAGICGLSIPDDTTIYGCGIYNSPAFIIKSIDGGASWTYIDMSLYASALVEVHFISADTGFAAGRAMPQTNGGVILYTTDGGVSWQVLHQTMQNLDYVWKIQSPDGKHYYGSISSPPSSPNTSFLSSVDGGLNWTQGLVNNSWYDIQMIGFIDSLTGWTGGDQAFFETTDGGLTWRRDSTSMPGARRFNRFWKKNDSTAFTTAGRIYKYQRNSIMTTSQKGEQEDELHFIHIVPNPTRQLRFEIKIGVKTHAVVQLINSKGEVVENFYDGTFLKGTYPFSSKKKYASQSMFLIMRTNDGFYSEKVIIE